MRLSVLAGSVEISGDNGARKRVERPVEARLAAALALRSPGPVDPDVLVEATWGERLPANPSAALQTSISRLRKLLASSGEDHLRHFSAGYQLNQLETDVGEFTELVRARHDETADARMSRLSRALALAPATGLLGGLRETEWLENEARVLEQMRVRAAEEYFALAIRLGRQNEIMVDLSEMAERNPDRESLWSLWMLALYRSGSRAEALSVYQQIRDYLATELGLEPSKSLETVEEAILTGNEELLRRAGFETSQSRRPSSVPHRVGGFYGRVWESGELNEMIDSAQLIGVVGLTGVGKSRLVAEVCANRPEAVAGAIWWSVISPEAEAPVAQQLLADAGVTSDVDDPMEGIVSAVPYDPVIIVLDGVDDRAEEAAEVGRMITDSRPLAKVIVTSSAFPRFPDFRMIELGPLEISGPAGPGSSPADLMLKDRLKRRNLGVDIDDRELSDLASRVGGWPLALEILAGHLESPAGRHRLQSGSLLSLTLTDSPRYGSAVSLTDLLEDSLQWLDDETQTAFMVASVFEAAFTVDFALSVLSPWFDSNRALDLLDHLQRHSLLAVDSSSVWSGYRMADAVRIFARTRAESEGILTAARESVLRVFAEIGSRMESIVRSTWANRGSIASAHGLDLAAAIEFASKTSDPRLASVVALRAIELANEGRMAQAVWETDRIATADLEPSLELMICHVARAAYLCDVHNNKLAGPVYGAPLAGWFEVHPREDWLEQSRMHIERAQSIGAGLGVGGTAALLGFARAAQRMALGDPHGAIDSYGDSLSELESRGDIATLNIWRYRLAEAHFAAGLDKDAERLFGDVASVSEDFGLRLMRLAALSGLARMAIASQKWALASDYLTKAENIADQTREPLAFVLNALREMYVGMFAGDRDSTRRARDRVSELLNNIGSLRLHRLFSIFDTIETASAEGWNIEPVRLKERTISIARGDQYKAAEMRLVMLQFAERDGADSMMGLYGEAIDTILDPASRRGVLNEVTGLGGYGTYLLCARAAYLCGDEGLSVELAALAARIRHRYRMTPSPSPLTRDDESVDEIPDPVELWEEVDARIPTLRRALTD